MENEWKSALMSTTVILGALLGGCALLMMYVINIFKNAEEEVPPKKNERATEQSDRKRETSTHVAKGKKKTADSRWGARSDKQGFSHPWLLTSLKGHTGQVLDMDFSGNGKYLASCAEDRTVLLWDVRDLTQKEHKSLRINVEFDYATFVKWSPDTKAFIIHRYNENCIEVYKVDKKKDGWLGSTTKAMTFPKAHESDVVGMAISCNGKFMMTCSNKTDLVIWDLRGQKLATVDTYLMSTDCAKISPCGRFVVAAGFAPDVKVWEVIFNKSGEFQEVKRVFELTGHTSGVYDVAFDVDSSHMATVSKDGTWKLFDTKIEYKKGEDPHLRITGKYDQGAVRSLIALSPNAENVVIATGNSLAFYSTITGTLDYCIENIYTGNITALLFDSLGKYVLTSGDRHIRVFHNVTGYRTEISTAKEKLKQNQTSATKERLEKLIEDNQAFLQQIEKNKKQ